MNNPNSFEELITYISDKVNAKHTYQSSADAMWEISLAAFNFAAEELGTTGWQASHAELMFLAKSRRINGPFAIVSGQDLLYPQYDIASKVEKYIDSWMPWAIQQCKQKLETEDRKYVADSVWQHWQNMAFLEDAYPMPTTE